jgi:hypothetical protein
VVSPPQQPQQQHVASPRSYHQLHQLLPAAPLQHLSHGHNQTSSVQPQHNKHSHIVRSSGSGSGSGFRSMLSGFYVDAADSTAAGSADQAHSLATPTQQRMHSAGSGSSIAPADALSPVQLLAVCAAVLQEEPAFQAAGITPLLLASVCLIESGGCQHAKQHREHLGDTAHGLCQVSGLLHAVERLHWVDSQSCILGARHAQACNRAAVAISISMRPKGSGYTRQ